MRVGQIPQMDQTSRYRADFREAPLGEVRRTPLPRTPVNKLTMPSGDPLTKVNSHKDHSFGGCPCAPPLAMLKRTPRQEEGEGEPSCPTPPTHRCSRQKRSAPKPKATRPHGSLP